MFWPCHFYLSLHFIACLVLYFPHFIATQGYISFLAYLGVLVISLLPRTIFHCLPGAIFSPFHCCPGLYFIPCLGRCVCISFLPRAIFHFLPRAMFIPFHCYSGLHFIACLVQSLYHFIPTQGNISFLA